jgi:hypothetical protein
MKIIILKRVKGRGAGKDSGRKTNHYELLILRGGASNDATQVINNNTKFYHGKSQWMAPPPSDERRCITQYSNCLLTNKIQELYANSRNRRHECRKRPRESQHQHPP